MMSERFCTACGKALSRDEVGLSLKLYGTDSKELFCMSCLSERMRCSVDLGGRRIIKKKKTGCALFC